ncbi:MAG: polysaccharide deacetylase [Rhodospirillaceae bacterium]|nr:polysaccharide deacetylase [Rhodospirillaceae bacterium]|tara:strand:+ start:696 stop:1562 length:867 start_codon:yes stop_codon:yes gene_type:complete
MRPHERLPYSAIVDRPKLPLPDNGRVAVWTIVNVEEWSIDHPMPRAVLPPPRGEPLLPDLANWAWHEYGMRVGFWRILEAIRATGHRATLATNGSVCHTYPRVIEAAVNYDWEIMGHGFLQGPMHKVPDQRKSIRDTIDAIRNATGKPPRGWESPGLTETFETPDLLAEEGIEYVADWVVDDQPVEISTTAGKLISVPYTVEVNDIPMMALQQHTSDTLLRRGIDHFDRLYEEGANHTRVMAISVHPFLSGAPHRIKYLEELYDYILSKPDVCMMTGEEILDWYKAVR